MSAGRSAWLCHGTMPPGSIVTAEAKLAILDLRRFLGKIDGAERRVGDALCGNRGRFPRILLDLIGRTLPGDGG